MKNVFLRNIDVREKVILVVGVVVILVVIVNFLDVVKVYFEIYCWFLFLEWMFFGKFSVI